MYKRQAASRRANGASSFLRPPPRMAAECIRFSNTPISTSSAAAITISTSVADRMVFMSFRRMPRVITLPRPPPPTKAANTAVPMALTTAMRMPVNMVGNASGSSTMTTR